MKQFSHDDVQSIKAHALAGLVDLVQLLFAGQQTHVQAHEIRIGRRGSLAIRRCNATWFNHEDGAHGDIVALVEYALNCDFKAALAWLQGFCGGNAQPVTASPSPEKQKAEDERRAIRQRAKAKALWLSSKPVTGGTYA